MSQPRPMWRRVAPSANFVPYRSGSASVLSANGGEVRKRPIGFAPPREDWGEAAWTARDLADA